MIMKETFILEMTYVDDILVVKTNSNLTAPNIKIFVEKMKNVIELAKDDLIRMDLTEAKAIDSMGITFLIGVYKTLTTQNRKIELIGVSDSMLRLLKTMKLDSIFGIDELTGGSGED